MEGIAMEPTDIERVGELFQEFTKYRHFTAPSLMVRGAPVPEAEKSVLPDAAVINLLASPDLPPARTRGLFDVLRTRRSRRDYSLEPLVLEDLGALLWSVQGVVVSGRGYTLRTAPSAGARHPLDTYIMVNRVDGLAPGLCRYSPAGHRLVRLGDDASVAGRLAAACLGQEILRTAAVSFVWTAAIERGRWKYQQRAYRYIYLDAGHACQNLYLACEAMGLGCCAVAAFDDDEVDRILGLDGREEFTVYLATVGRVKAGRVV
jgi:SagB-type dehydrogenase family enzyme